MHDEMVGGLVTQSEKLPAVLGPVPAVRGVGDPIVGFHTTPSDDQPENNMREVWPESNMNANTNFGISIKFCLCPPSLIYRAGQH